MDAVQPYIKSTQVFNCPSQSTYSTTAAGEGLYDFRNGGKYGSYVINSAYYAAADNLTSPGGEFISLAAVASPSTTIWVGDGNGFFEANWDSVTNNPILSTTDPKTLNNYVERHLNTINDLYIDGHVKAVRLDSLVKKGSAGQYSAYTIEDD